VNGRSLLLSVFAALFTLAGVVNAAQPTDFRFFSTIAEELPAQTPVRLPLPREVIAATSNDFADVRVFDETGLETPYVIHEQREAPRTAFTFTVLSYHQTEAVEEIVLERPKDTGPIQELAFFTSARDFKKSVHVMASRDFISWRDIGMDTIFDFSSRIDLRHARVALPETEAPYLKLVLHDETSPQPDSPDARVYYDGVEVFLPGKRTKPFRIDRIEGRADAFPETFRRYDHTMFTNPQVTTDENRNTIVPLGQVNLPIAEIALTVENVYYHRRVELWAAESEQKNAYRFLAGGTVYKIPGMNKPENTLQVQQSQRQYLQLKIINGDNPPLRLQQVELAWVRRNLYFIPEAGQRYKLYFGNPQVTTPNYELKHILQAEPRTLNQYVAVSLGAVRSNPDYRPSVSRSAREKFERIAFITVILLLVCGMSLWLYRLLRRISV